MAQVVQNLSTKCETISSKSREEGEGGREEGKKERRQEGRKKEGRKEWVEKRKEEKKKDKNGDGEPNSN
jgi:hypothetical protein